MYCIPAKIEKLFPDSINKRIILRLLMRFQYDTPPLRCVYPSRLRRINTFIFVALLSVQEYVVLVRMTTFSLIARVRS